MGNLREAMKCYRKCLSLDDYVHQAKAGLAEVSKQKGHFHRAIAGYQDILKSGDSLGNEIEDGPHESAELVYQIALAGLLRMTGQYERAERTLKNLLERAPRHQSAHFELGRIYTLQGQMALANDHYGKASRVRSIQQAVVRDLAGVAIAVLAGESDRCMPDEEGLKKCFSAYSAIDQSDAVRANEILSTVNAVDRQMRDLSRVLNFQALRMQGNEVNYKKDFYLSRIAKRGDRSLRQAIRWISDGDFVAATETERLFLLRVA